ncbi:MAG: O-antigen ligase family protein [Anaerolineae bacterium]|nr:O-antigen ligase family protein [Anaerolineae bacterium]
MITTLRYHNHRLNLLAISIILAVLALAFLLGQRASVTWLGLLLAAVGAVALLLRPTLGLLAIVILALLLPLEIGTGTDVKLNAVTFLIPALLALGMLDMVRRRRIVLVPSRVNLPLALFLLAGLFSLIFGIITWDPVVPRSSNLLLVQLAQWAIFALSAGAFWLTTNLIKDIVWLRRLTWAFLLVAGGVAVLSAVPGFRGIINRLTTIAFVRAPLWVLLFGLATGQLFFNRHMTTYSRVFLIGVIVAVIVYAFVEQREAISNWVGIGAVFGVLVWLRYPRARWLILVIVALLATLGILFPAIYNFAGGDTEWQVSGESRIILIERVIEVTSRNPITGLGPAAYRAYGAMSPLRYRGANWILPQINSHNNFVDLYAHVGIVGLVIFFWFAAEIALLGRRLHTRYTSGFASGYVNGMLAVGAGALVLMVFADWMLPFVYNIGFPGFQASVLVWLFLGGLVALENMPAAGSGGQ